jgi:hypothetical protein
VSFAPNLPGSTNPIVTAGGKTLPPVQPQMPPMVPQQPTQYAPPPGASGTYMPSMHPMQSPMAPRPGGVPAENPGMGVPGRGPGVRPAHQQMPHPGMRMPMQRPPMMGRPGGSPMANPGMPQKSVEQPVNLAQLQGQAALRRLRGM